MSKPNGWDSVESKVGESTYSNDHIPGGGQVCEILSVAEIISKSGSPMYKVSFDVAQGQYEGFYRKQYMNKVAKFGDNAKWGGVYIIFVNSKDGMCSPYFKGFITCIEKSNLGFKWDFTPQSLAHKKIGFVFGIEQYYKDDGTIGESYKARWACSASEAASQKEPEPKPPRKDDRNAPIPPFPTVEDTDDDLPWGK